MEDTSIQVTTIYNPEFINLQPLEINPLMSSCEIKVLYLGENRNHSYITKEVASEMAKTLRGAPIAGWYSEDKEDFRDHGEVISIDVDGFKIKKMTRPYGFVAPDAKVWFQKFDETDAFGNVITREYLMTTGYIWSGQYEEAKAIIERGKSQSMELDENSLQGNWAENKNSGIEFFIINDAIFSQLCVLGDDVEPCFEGAKVTAPEISASFTKDSTTFKKSLYDMMQELNFALKGGLQVMENENVIETEQTITPKVEETPVEKILEEQGNLEQTVIEENQEITEEVSETVAEEVSTTSENFTKEEEKEEDINKVDNEEDKDKYALLEKEYSALKEEFSTLQTELNELRSFKLQIEDAKKDDMIKSFVMLSDEDKKDVIENKSKYSLDEIEAKLSVICVRNKVNFNLDSTDTLKTEEEKPVVTFNLMTESDGPAWISAVKKNRNKKND